MQGGRDDSLFINTFPLPSSFQQPSSSTTPYKVAVQHVHSVTMARSLGHAKLWQYSHSAAIFAAVFLFTAGFLCVLLWTNGIVMTQTSASGPATSTFTSLSPAVSTFSITYNVVRSPFFTHSSSFR